MTGLPLMESALLAIGAGRKASALVSHEPRKLLPARAPLEGEQYRFHFDMTKCIGCKCCVVACNEQNGNPAAINWRRVGEVEGGHYPRTRRYHLSMGCNHCLEPSCLIGCPVEAYTRDRTGIVLHSADACIGCQYCTWNCSYGVPQYNSERGVVGKCDMCHHRLQDHMAPACVGACPEGALAIEIVNIEEWRRNHLSADAPGLPSSGDSISTTRITLPDDLPPETGRVDTQRIEPENPHWPLVFMLVLTQLSAGAFIALCVLAALGESGRIALAALVSLGLSAISLAASTLHLGRPIYALRALKGLRRSWLSREVLALSSFAAASGIFAVALLLNLPARIAAGVVASMLGIAGLTCSARIYMVRARPAWAAGYTMAEFFSTAALLGPSLVGMLAIDAPAGMRIAAMVGAAGQFATQLLKFLWLARSDVFELRASSLLLSGRLRNIFLLRIAVLPVVLAFPPAVAFGVALAGELLGRYLFFVSVVPKNMAAAFTRRAA